MNVSVVYKVYNIVLAGSAVALNCPCFRYSASLELTGSVFYMTSVFCHVLPLFCCELLVGGVSYDKAINEPK